MSIYEDMRRQEKQDFDRRREELERQLERLDEYILELVNRNEEECRQERLLRECECRYTLLPPPLLMLLGFFLGWLVVELCK